MGIVGAETLLLAREVGFVCPFFPSFEKWLELGGSGNGGHCLRGPPDHQ